MGNSCRRYHQHGTPVCADWMVCSSLTAWWEQDTTVKHRMRLVPRDILKKGNDRICPFKGVHPNTWPLTSFFRDLKSGKWGAVEPARRAVWVETTCGQSSAFLSATMSTGIRALWPQTQLRFSSRGRSGWGTSGHHGHFQVVPWGLAVDLKAGNPCGSRWGRCLQCHKLSPGYFH